MPVDETRKQAEPDLEPLFHLWRIDAATIEVLRRVEPILLDALAENEAELYLDLLEDPRISRLMGDPAARQQELEALAGFWHTVFGGGLDRDTLRRASLVGRQHVELGMGGRYFLAGCQRVLKCALEALLAASPPDRDHAIDAVSRVVLLAADAALSAYYDSVADLVSEIEVHRETEQLHRQLKQLEELAHVDGLTKLFNRRHFDRALESELARANRQHRPLSLVMADLDHFKQVNDSFGHQVGDRVLCHVADIMRAMARRSDVLARYGGEEFALILPDTGAEQARLAAERLREAIAEKPLPLQDERALAISISAGVAAFDGAEMPPALVERADSALYRAKGAGRNCVAS